MRHILIIHRTPKGSHIALAPLQPAVKGSQQKPIQAASTVPPSLLPPAHSPASPCSEFRRHRTLVHRAMSNLTPDLSCLLNSPLRAPSPRCPRGAEARGAQSPPRVARHPSRRSQPHYSAWAAIQQQAAQIHRPKEMQTRRWAKQRSR